MKPFPTTSPYVPPPDAHPRRPWWDKSFVTGCSRLINRVRWTVSWSGDVTQDTEEGFRVIQPDVPRQASVDAILAWIDRTHPLPAPALCPGQVWLLAAKNLTITVMFDTYIGYDLAAGRPMSPPSDVPRGFDLGRTAPSNDERGWGGCSIGGRFFTGPEAEQLLLRGTEQWSAFLLFNPLDPTGRPWTGAKE